MEINNPTLHERLIKLTELELLELADGEAVAIAVSCAFEGLVLDQDKIRADLLDGYRVIRNRK